MKTNATQSYGTMNSTGVSNDTIGAGWHITFSYCLSREDPVDQCSSEMTSVSQLSDLTVLRSALRLSADHLSSEAIRRGRRFRVSLALTGTLPLISEAKPISQIHLSSSDPQPHPDRNQGHRFRSLLLQRVPDWRRPGGSMLGRDIPSLQRSHLPIRFPPASVLTDRRFLKFSAWLCWRHNFLSAAVAIVHGWGLHRSKSTADHSSHIT
jgi:hypothetical protein